MKLDCITVEEAIWDFAREGVELTPDALRHVESCNSCDQALADAETCFQALQCLKPYPEAPDCREQIALLLPNARKPRSSWQYAWAAAPVALAVFAVMIVFLWKGDRQVVRAPRPTGPQEIAVHREDHKPRGAPREFAVYHAPKSNRGKYVSAIAVAVRRRHQVPPALEHIAEQTQVAASPNPNVQRDERVVKAISVSWSARSDPRNVSYQYSETDHDTGVVTTGSVERSGNSINIILESNAAADKRPTKGEIGHEKNPSA